MKKGRETPSSFLLVTLSTMVYLALLLSEGQIGYHVFLFDCRKCAHVFVFDIFTQKIRTIKKKRYKKNLCNLHKRNTFLSSNVAFHASAHIKTRKEDTEESKTHFSRH